MLDEDRLAEIRAREQAATEGPWVADGWEIYQPRDGEPASWGRWIGETLNNEEMPQSEANAVFLAHARQDVPELLAEVIALREQLSKVTAYCAQRAEYVTNLRHCGPNNDHDYYRWTGHAAARRQLSDLLGLPVGWPAEDAVKTEVSA